MSDSSSSKKDDPNRFNYFYTNIDKDEKLFTLKEQDQTIKDAIDFTKYMCSDELFNLLDMKSITPLEGSANDSDLRIHTTRILTEYMNRMKNSALDRDLYKHDEISTLYNSVKPPASDPDVIPSTSSPPPIPSLYAPYNTPSTKEEDKERLLFEEQFTNYHKKRYEITEDLRKCLLPKEPITDKDMKREIITIRYDESVFHMKILIENYVYVTYIGNKNETNKRYKFNLLDMAAKTLGFGIQHSKNKFSKNDLRYRWGSHLIFESSVIVETGSTNPILAAKLLEHTMNVFKYVCGYHNIDIKERKCHNVVATGILNFGLCLELLKERYPFVTYEKKNFAGAIIRINDIDNHSFASLNSNKLLDLQDNDEYINYEKNKGYRNDEEIYNKLYNTNSININKEYSNISDENEKDIIRKNLNIDYNDNNTKSTANNNRYEVNYDEFDLFHPSRTNKEKNVTALVFPLGQVICVGNKSREGVTESYTKLYSILYQCRDTPENIKLEKQILQTRRYNYTKNKKRNSKKKNKKTSNKEEEEEGDNISLTSNKKKRKHDNMDNDDIQQPQTSKKQKKEDYIKCVHCEFIEKKTNFRLEKSVIISDYTTLCDNCNRCVCNDCFKLSYTGDIRYKSYKNSNYNEEFNCLDCMHT